ncbi:MAG TPA: type II toxin-antitoxin system VapC family toxin [Terracidiphilus sp.]|nr:type II toxin-antitoxin system VapC family toxin [Terracidiphilus sp.]
MPVLFDSSIYIQALRRSGDVPPLWMRWAGKEPVWLSAVVLHELYLGSKAGDRRIIGKLEYDFGRAGRMLVPNLGDWVKAGTMLAHLARKYGYERIGRARLTNDALIAVSAARAGIEVITANRRDFAALSEFCPLRWQERMDFGN